MFVSTRRVATLGVAGLMALGLGVGGLESTAQAQVRRVFPPTVGSQSMNNVYRINPNPVIDYSGGTLQQAAYNTAVVGQAASTIPPYLLGYNPYPQAVNYGQSPPPITPYIPPYALSAGGSPYASNPYYAGATLSTTPYGSGGGGYGLSTTPGGLGSAGSYGANPYLNGSAYSGGPTSGEMYGTAAIVSATGEYFATIQKARLTREQARQAAIQTRRMLIQEEAEYERMRPRAIDLIRREQATDLAIARGDANAATVFSGKALNDLLRSINRPGKKLNTGPQIPLDEDTLKNINLIDPGFKGQVGMLKITGKLKWPTVLEDAAFEEARNGFTSKFKFAVQQLKDREPLEPATIRNLNAFLKTLNKKVSDEELSPSQYIEARKYLNQLDQAVRALDDPNVAKAFSDDWKAKGATVAELVKNMKGLQFAPATPGEERAYNELYRAMRSFEAGLQIVTSTPRER